jgi:hypothetical protein
LQHFRLMEIRIALFWSTADFRIGSRFRLGIVRHQDYVTANAKALAAKADVVVVAAGFDPETESEAADRTFRLPPGQDELIREMVGSMTEQREIPRLAGGGGGIRTHETLSGLTVFKTAGVNRFPTPPANSVYLQVVTVPTTNEKTAVSMFRYISCVAPSSRKMLVGAVGLGHRS